MVFVIFAKVYDALYGMVGSVWSATFGLMVGFVIGSAVLLLYDVLFSMDIPQSPLLRFLFPLRMSLLFFIAYNFFCVRITLQLSSHNFTRDIGDALRKCSKTMAFWGRSDNFCERGNFPWCVTSIKSLFGNRTKGPGQCSI